MSTTLDREKSELLAKAIDLALARKGSGGPPHDTVGSLLKSYYRHVAPEDVCDRTDIDLYGALASHYKTAGTRPQGTAQVRVFTPAVSEAGWTAGGHSVVEVVTDDMPFLVDSLTMELTRQLRDVHAVIHPQFDVIRDITGALQSVAPVADGSIEPPTDAIRESWMHIEIARVPDDEDTGAIEESLLNVLRDVRESVEDWEKMHGQVLAIVDELKADGLAAVRGGDRAGQRAAALAGLRPLHVPRLPRVPPRARGRRRDAARGPRHRPRHPARRPEHVGLVRQAARPGQAEGAREDPAGPGQGQLAGHRPPPGVPRLRRREDSSTRTAR